jgi:hypothetical protein
MPQATKPIEMSIQILIHLAVFWTVTTCWTGTVILTGTVGWAGPFGLAGTVVTGTVVSSSSIAPPFLNLLSLF